MEYFNYGPRETEYLKKRDKDLGRTIDNIGHIKREVTPDPFLCLIRNGIISQQISGKAAASVWKKFMERLSPITPANIASAGTELIRGAGMSERKALYIKYIAEAAASGYLDKEKLDGMSDKQIIKHLCTLKGVGIWTAEMCMIFSLQRQDILSLSDFGIRKGLAALYGVETIEKDFFEECRARYSPYCSVASLYLWAVAENC